MRKKAVLVGLGLLGLGLLASEVIFPRYVISPRESRARVLAADVATMRAICSQYTLDQGKRPESLETSSPVSTVATVHFRLPIRAGVVIESITLQMAGLGF